MKLSDLIHENTESEDILFEDRELNEVYKGKRYSTKDLTNDVQSFYSKSGTKGNPYKSLTKKYTNPYGSRDIGAEVKGLPNAREILELSSDYKKYIAEIEKLSSEFDSWLSTTKAKVSKARDDDATTHKSLPREIKTKLNSFYSQFKHYSKLIEKSYEKALKVNPMITKSKEKSAVKGRISQQKNDIATNRKEKTDKFKANVIGKVNTAGDKAVNFSNDWKNKVKGLTGNKEKMANLRAMKKEK